jgi:hypothetical protein
MIFDLAQVEGLNLTFAFVMYKEELVLHIESARK